MNIKTLRNKGWIVFEAISGSHAYGTNIEGSDVDIRGVYIQPTKDLLGLTNYVPQVSDETNDVTFYEIGRFIELLAKGNPNMLELLNMPEEQVVFKSPVFDQIFTESLKEKFITTKLKHTFTGFAYAQIKKAQGMGKKINWEEDRVTRKDVLDFCYVLTDKESSVRFKDWTEKFNFHQYVKDHQIEGEFSAGKWYPISITQANIGLAKVNNMPDLYSMYALNEGGIIGEDSNDVQLRSIPKNARHIGYLRFAKSAYSQHCKDFKEYKEWLEKRNPVRYEHTQNHGKGYDGKNLLHTFRLLGMAKDIAEGRGIVVRRPDAKELIKIRLGERELDEMIEQAEENVAEIKEAFDKSGLPREVSAKFLNKLLTNIRLQHGDNN